MNRLAGTQAIFQLREIPQPTPLWESGVATGFPRPWFRRMECQERPQPLAAQAGWGLDPSANGADCRLDILAGASLIART
jgi:hypothetical protein